MLNKLIHYITQSYAPISSEMRKNIIDILSIYHYNNPHIIWEHLLEPHLNALTTFFQCEGVEQCFITEAYVAVMLQEEFKKFTHNPEYTLQRIEELRQVDPAFSSLNIDCSSLSIE